MPVFLCFTRKIKAQNMNIKKKEKIKARLSLRFVYGAILCVLIAASFSLSSSAAWGGEENGSAFSVYVDEAPQGEITVTLATADAVRVCGIAAELTFDDGVLVFTGAKISQELSEQGFLLSVSEENGKISLIVDGSQNVSCDTLVSLIFVPLGGEDTFTSIDVSVKEAYFWNDGELELLHGLTSSLNVALSGDVVGADLPRLLSSSVFALEDDLVLELSGAFPSNCIAVGFEVFVADLSEIDASEMLISRVLPNGSEEKRACFSIETPNKSRLCVVITPVSFSREGTVIGRETVILIGDGKIVG